MTEKQQKVRLRSCVSKRCLARCDYLQAHMKTHFKVFACLGLLTGCVSHNTPTYQQRVACVTRQNASYISKNGYAIAKRDTRTGLIIAKACPAAKSLKNLNIKYNEEQINPYIAYNDCCISSLNPNREVISTITSFWTGK